MPIEVGNYGNKLIYYLQGQFSVRIFTRCEGESVETFGGTESTDSSVICSRNSYDFEHPESKILGILVGRGYLAAPRMN